MRLNTNCYKTKFHFEQEYYPQKVVSFSFLVATFVVMIYLAINIFSSLENEKDAVVIGQKISFAEEDLNQPKYKLIMSNKDQGDEKYTSWQYFTIDCKKEEFDKRLKELNK